MNEAPPVPLEDKLAKDLSPKELRELLNRAQQRESESTSIKTEDEATTGVKRERIIDDDDDEVTYVETRQRKRPHVEREIIVLD
ncbi:hypothetical protein J4E90_001658 [Alternaria incomplexa]|uniref:uncharacterized protein n=1 Tax=Alternaria incomplexa TaxID=1187928 RepID=UPI00221FAB94|nr:uncharacterized protein J4E90_001658 [Alternaria incomplexa]KAI4919523.1 hypothetical protein J4E90_001658 [Alternaria incomplexa]